MARKISSLERKFARIEKKISPLYPYRQNRSLQEAVLDTKLADLIDKVKKEGIE